MLSPSLETPSLRFFGLTGGIASGKSTVANMFRAKGLPVVDADELAREVVQPGTDGHRRILAAFPTVGRANLTIDRAALGHLVFADPNQRSILEAIVHPAIQALSRTRLHEAALASPSHTALYDAALLFENGLQSQFSGVVLVVVPPEIQLKRLRERTEMTDAEAQARLSAQWPLEKKKPLAQWIIDNAGTRAETASQVESVAQKLLGLRKSDTRGT
jgi:dephospho-CoA kinase